MSENKVREDRKDYIVTVGDCRSLIIVDSHEKDHGSNTWLLRGLSERAIREIMTTYEPATVIGDETWSRDMRIPGWIPVKRVDVIGDVQQSYNGWANYETFVTVSWLENDEKQREKVEKLVRRWASVWTGAESLKHWVKKSMALTGLAADLAGAGLDSVRWVDVVRYFLSE